MAKEKENKVKNDNKRFMKDVKAELKRVTWPTSKQMVSNVTAVITIVLVTAIIVFCLDLVFSAIDKYGVDKLKQQVQSANQTQTQITDTVTTDQQSNNTDEGANAEENNENTESTDNAENTDNTESTNTEGTESTEGTENNETTENTQND